LDVLAIFPHQLHVLLAWRSLRRHGFSMQASQIYSICDCRFTEDPSRFKSVETTLSLFRQIRNCLAER
jgi:hypothetical protein